MSTKIVRVRNVSLLVSNEELNDLFSRFGPIKSINLQQMGAEQELAIISEFVIKNKPTFLGFLLNKGDEHSELMQTIRSREFLWGDWVNKILNVKFTIVDVEYEDVRDANDARNALIAGELLLGNIKLI